MANCWLVKQEDLVSTDDFHTKKLRHVKLTFNSPSLTKGDIDVRKVRSSTEQVKVLEVLIGGFQLSSEFNLGETIRQ